jgi:hypothetical protein
MYVPTYVFMYVYMYVFAEIEWIVFVVEGADKEPVWILNFNFFGARVGDRTHLNLTC